MPTDEVRAGWPTGRRLEHRPLSDGRRAEVRSEFSSRPGRSEPGGARPVPICVTASPPLAARAAAVSGRFLHTLDSAALLGHPSLRSRPRKRRLEGPSWHAPRSTAAPGRPVKMWLESARLAGRALTASRARRGTRPRIERDRRFASAYLLGAICPAPRPRHHPGDADSQHRRHGRRGETGKPVTFQCRRRSSSSGAGSPLTAFSRQHRPPAHSRPARQPQLNATEVTSPQYLRGNCLSHLRIGHRRRLSTRVAMPGTP